MSQPEQYQQVADQLRQTYDRSAAERDKAEISAWKVEERAHFLKMLGAENKPRLLEIGAGPGKDSLFFQENGLQVVCTDLSPEMVRLCRAKGLEAYEMDFLGLDFPEGSFDAIYALNCLLHVPKADLPGVLEVLRRLLKPGGLLYYGVFGGKDTEGPWEGDPYQPKRFYAFYSDAAIQKAVAPFFKLLYFKVIAVDKVDLPYFQSMIWQRE